MINVSKFFIFFFIIFLIASTGLRSYSQETKQELSSSTSESTILVTATKIELKETETPVSTSKIKKSDIKRVNSSSVKNLLEKEVGVETVNGGSGSVNPMIRGLNGERVLILYDGIRISEHRGTEESHVLSIDPFQVEELEILRGPYSFLWGSDAIGGVINFTPFKADRINKPGLRLGGFARSFLQTNGYGHKESIALKSGYDGFNFFVQGIYNDFEDIKNGNEKKIKYTFNKGFTFNSSFNYLWGDNIIEVGGYLFKKDEGIPHRPEEGVNLEASKFKDEEHQLLMFNYEKKSLTNILKNFKFKAGYQNHKNNHYVVETDPIEKTKEELSHNLQTFHAYPQLDIVLSRNNIITTGMSFFKENGSADASETNYENNVETSKEYSKPMPNCNRTNIGFFIQDRINIDKSISIIPGIRYDYYNVRTEKTENHPIEPQKKSYNILSGNIGSVYNLDNQNNIYGNLGTAYRVPTIMENFFYGVHHEIIESGNPDLKPEKSINIDLGYRLNINKWFKAGVSFFFNRITDYISEYPTGSTSVDEGLPIYSYDNISTAVIYGSEISTQLKLNMWTLFMNASYLLGKDTKSDTYLSSMPPFKGKYGIKYTYLTKWFGFSALWVELDGVSTTKQTKLSPEEREAGLSETPGWTKFDFRSGIDLNQDISFVFAVENILNEKYHDHLSKITWMDEQPGRNFTLGITYNF